MPEQTMTYEAWCGACGMVTKHVGGACQRCIPGKWPRPIPVVQDGIPVEPAMVPKRRAS